MVAPPPPEGKERSYAEDLVYTTTEDGVTLEGAVIRPRIPFARDESEGQSVGRDIAVVWMHGLTSRFYSLTAVGIGRELAARGFTFITGNNRGHDFGFVLRRAPNGRITLGGGGWERFSESPHDVGAWVTFATNLGFRGVLLAGHSLGALKVGYYQALRQDDRVLGIVAASPPVSASRVDPALLAIARRLVDAGQGEELLPWGSSPAGAGRLSAGTYLDRVDTGLDIYGFHPVAAQPDAAPPAETDPLSVATPPAMADPPAGASPPAIADLADPPGTASTTAPLATGGHAEPPASAFGTPPAANEGADVRAEERVPTASEAPQPLPGTHLVSRIRCPIFACYGTDEAWVGGAAELDAIRRAATGTSRVETRLFPGADHSYAGHASTIAAALAEWLTSLDAPPADRPASSA